MYIIIYIYIGTHLHSLVLWCIKYHIFCNDGCIVKTSYFDENGIQIIFTQSSIGV